MSRINIKNKLILAPMAGYSDMAFRIISFRQGADISYSEMVSAKALMYGDKRTKSMLEVHKEETCVAIQLFGSDPEILAKATKHLDNLENVNIIDLNIGCPAPKIYKNEEGSALLKNPSLIYKILSSMRKETEKPLSAKMRLGISDKNNYLEIAKAIEESGVDFLIVHGRTKDQFYSGVADWEAIGNIKAKVDIPVIGNGDIDINTDINKVISDYNVDSVMIGRGAVGAPWVFNKLKADLENTEYKMPSIEEKFEVIKEHIELICEFKGEKIGIPEMRKHLHGYLKGMKNSAKLKNKINTVKTKEEIIHILDGYKVERLTSN